MAAHDPQLEEYTQGILLVSGADSYFRYVTSFSSALFPDPTVARAVKYLVCQVNHSKFLRDGNDLYDYYGNKDLTPDERYMAKVSLSRGITEYLANLNIFKGALPQSTDTDDTQDYANLRYVVDQTIEKVTAVQALLPDACPPTP